MHNAIGLYVCEFCISEKYVLCLMLFNTYLLSFSFDFFPDLYLVTCLVCKNYKVNKMYRLPLTSAVSTFTVRKLFAANKIVTCASYFSSNILCDCLNASIPAVQHSASLRQLLQVLSTHASCQDTSLMNALLNKLIAFDIDDASSLAIAQAVVSTEN